MYLFIWVVIWIFGAICYQENQLEFKENIGKIFFL